MRRYPTAVRVRNYNWSDARVNIHPQSGGRPVRPSGEEPRLDRGVPRELHLLCDALGRPRRSENDENDRGPERTDRHGYLARLRRDAVNAFSFCPTLNSHCSNKSSVLLPF